MNSSKQIIINGYNIDNLLGLTRLLCDNLYKESSENSVIDYKNQVNKLLKEKKVSESEVKIIEQVAGMQNTNKLKWQLSLDYLTDFELSLTAMKTGRELSTILPGLENAISSKVLKIIKQKFKIKSTKKDAIITLEKLLLGFETKYNFKLKIYSNDKLVGIFNPTFLVKADKSVKRCNENNKMLPSEIRQLIINGNYWELGVNTEAGWKNINGHKDNLLKTGLIDKLRYIEKTK